MKNELFITLMLLVLARESRCATPDAASAWEHDRVLIEKQIKAFDANSPAYARLRKEALRKEALIAPSDRDAVDVVLRRTVALLNRLKALPEAPGLATEKAELEALALTAVTVPPGDKTKRNDLYARICAVRRRIAFKNPLLDFDRLIFLAKHRPMRGDHHMCDQYCGFNARPGGGVRILLNPFSESPTVTDPLAGQSPVTGRFAGKALKGGAFNTLDLDYDGETILFAWCECGTPPEKASWESQPWDAEEAKRNRHEQYFWCPETTYHLFSARTDGTQLAQLTDGRWNDFDPCFLPNGRIAFISERRGGYLRCGGNRPNPTYALYGMMRDGSDIISLSYHETHEWNPSVDNDGMLVYSRWDYVDRDSDCAHHIWICYPDGRDPRSFHGNYPRQRELRPWMELSIRAIPNSHRYVAVAAPHHGYNYGSLVLIDQSIPDDDACSQLKRITPEVPFPESESSPGVPHGKGKHSPRAEIYGTPWPLSEDFYLCVYDAGQKHYAIALLDGFGNRELIYRDPTIACLDPIPLRARSRPPVIPVKTTQAATDGEGHSPSKATVTVLNIYDADFNWPPDTRIAALRVVQLFPKSTFHLTRPMIGTAAQSLTRASLGTVPVESDGSVRFEAPVGVPIYFQALDDRGCAVQSMRSLTYVHAGEQLTCIGCHETKHRVSPPRERDVMALKKPPQQLEPEYGSRDTINFATLVQPVLDKHCVTCHAQRKKGQPDLSGKTFGHHGWSTAYHSLRRYAWGLSGGNGVARQEGARSIPGKLGARASRLFKHLDTGHHDVQLTNEAWRRLIVWLDCNSNFYGAYHDTDRQARGELVAPAVQ